MKSISIVNGKWTDSKPGSKLLPGDIIQYRNTKLGNTTATQHTSIVAAVNTAGSATFVYEQNFNAIRTVQKNSIDLTKLVSGYLRIYRPKARVNRTGQTKFSITNITKSSQTIAMFVGTRNLGTFSLTSDKTLASYQTRWVTLTGSTQPITLRLSNGASISVANAGGYQIYTTAAGAAALKLTP